MKSFKIDSTTKVTLYHKECYGCDESGKFDPLRRFILDKRISLSNFIPKRIELNPEWQNEALLLDMNLPALVFENPDGDKKTIQYDVFVKELTQSKKKSSKRGRAKPKCAALGAISERVTDGTASHDSKEKTNGESKGENKE